MCEPRFLESQYHNVEFEIRIILQFTFFWLWRVTLWPSTDTYNLLEVVFWVSRVTSVPVHCRTSACSSGEQWVYWNSDCDSVAAWISRGDLHAGSMYRRPFLRSLPCSPPRAEWWSMIVDHLVSASQGAVEKAMLPAWGCHAIYSQISLLRD